MSISGDSAPYLKITEDLRQQIADGRLAPGTKLPSQHQLAARHGVARATIQAALRVLKSQGLISSKQGAGHYVTDRPAGGVDVLICPARVELGSTQIAWLATLPMPAHGLVRILECDLDHGHPGPHASLGQHSFNTEWWVQWTLTALEINPLEPCPVDRVPGNDEDDDRCLLYAGHPGRHDYGNAGRL